jgi:hypothetical protein
MNSHGSVHSQSGTSINFGINGQTDELGPMVTRNVDTLHWGLSLQYGTSYLTSRYTPGKLPKNEPLYQFIPLLSSHSIPRAERNRHHDESRPSLCRGRMGDLPPQQRRRAYHWHARTSVSFP